MEDYYRPSVIGRGGPIVLTTVPGTDFVVKNHMVQLLRQNCQFHGFEGEDANEHLYKYLLITQFNKQNGIFHDIINLNLFPFSLTHGWFYTFKTHYIRTWEDMVSKFLSKYYPYSKALQLRKDIFNFQQLPTETVFEAWERFKSYLRKCPDHEILPVHQILTFYHGIIMIDRDKIMVAAGETDNFVALDLIPPGIYNEIFDAEGDILLLEKLLNIDPTKDLSPQELNNTPIGNSNFLLEETDTFLALDSIPPGCDNEISDAEGDILLLEKLLNIDSTKDLPPRELNNDFEGDILFLEKNIKG
nr:hypothetical protein [Tanacetum cinerariifolium]GEW31986.1 hypothetical protein [Tanacetum cinerariifolium]